MGVVGGSDSDSRFHTDVDVTFTMSGEADNGLTFGAAVDLDESWQGTNAGAANGAMADDDEDGGAVMFVEYGGVRLTMGDTDGALDWAMDEVDFGGAIRDDHTGHAGFSGNGGIGLGALAAGTPGGIDGGIGLDGLYDGQVALVTYSAGDLQLGASLEVSDEREFTLAGADWDAGAVMGLGAKYSMGGLAFGVGFQTVTVESETAGVDDLSARAFGASVHYTANELTVGINVGRNSYDLSGVDADLTHMGIGASYTMNSLTLAANYGQYNLDIDLAGAPEITNSGWGVSAVYDLGGA
jgi:outer membrane protein OmpU